MYFAFAWLNIDIQVFSILIVLMLIDSFLGGGKALRLGVRFSFKTMLIGITIKFVFLLVPLTLSLLAKQLGRDLTLSVDVVIKILSVAEVYSILGNIYTIKTKKEVERIDIISMILKSLRQALFSSAQRLMNDYKERK